MNFTVLTLFKDMIEGTMNTSITGRAIEKGLIGLKVIDIRDYACNKHNRVDDYPYGGGAGMVMQAEPVYKACEAARKSISKQTDDIQATDIQAMDIQAINVLDTDVQGADTSDEGTKAADAGTDKGSDPADKHIGKGQTGVKLIYLSPAGRRFDQNIAKELAREENLIFLCGHYEGIDERVLETEVDDYISLGDFVLTGGELPALCIMDAVSRLIPGVLNNDDSAGDESFEGNTLEYPQYTRPEEFMGKRVPEVLLSGHHANIERWRREQSLIKTMKNRPDMFEKVELDKKDKKFLSEYKAKQE